MTRAVKSYAWVFLLLMIGMLALPAQAQKTSPVDDYFRRGLDPFWRTNEMHESVFFFQPAVVSDKSQGSPEKNWPQAKLLFLPNQVLRVTSMSHEITYEPGRDYLVDERTGTLYLPPSSRIPFKTFDQLYPLLTAGDATVPFITKTGDPTRGILFGEGSFYPSLQAEVTYTLTPGQWTGYIPQYAGEILPKTTAKLQAQQQIKMFILGDSISQGYNASKWVVTPPFQPPYGELVAGGLETAFHAPRPSVGSYRNFAIAGWIATQGLQQVNNLRIGLDQPDLVLIAFGANDAFRHDPAGYKADIQAIMDAIRADSPNTEFILVSSLVANREWAIMPVDQFPLMRDALAQLTGPGVALADITSVWQTMLQRKTFYDITGNGVNHPNDFSHMLYAQTILSLLMPGPVAYVGKPAQTANKQTFQLDGSRSLPGPNG